MPTQLLPSFIYKGWLQVLILSLKIIKWAWKIHPSASATSPSPFISYLSSTSIFFHIPPCQKHSSLPSQRQRLSDNPALFPVTPPTLGTAISTTLSSSKEKGSPHHAAHPHARRETSLLDLATKTNKAKRNVLPFLQMGNQEQRY